MVSYIKFVLKFPKTILFCLAIITMIFLMGFPRLEFDQSIESMMPKKDKEYVFYKQTQAVYGNITKFAIFDVFSDNLWSHQAFKDIDDLITDIEEFKYYNKNLEDSRLEKFDHLLSQGAIEYNKLLNTFSDDGPFQRLLKRKIKDIFGKIEILEGSDLRKIRKGIITANKIKEKGHVERINCLFTMEDAVAIDDNIEYINIIKKDEYGKRILPKTEADFEEIKKTLLKTPFYEKMLYAKDTETGEITDFGVLIFLDDAVSLVEVARELWSISHNFDNITIISQGVPVGNMLVNGYLVEDMKTFIPPIVLIVIIVFLFNFRSIRGVILPLLTLLISDIWLIGFMGLCNFKITMMGVGLPTIIMAIGSSYSIHIMNQYYIDFDLISEKKKREGLLLSMSHISITVTLAGLTTCAGFFTLTTNQVMAIKEWAFLAGLGTIICVIVSVSLIPATLVLLKHKMSKFMIKNDKTVKTRLIDKIISLMTKISLEHYKGCMVVVVIALIISIIGMLKMNVETTPFGYFDEDSYIRTSDKIIGKKFGGCFAINFLIDSGEVDGIKNPEFLKKVDEIQQWLLSDECKELNLGKSTSIVDIIKKLNMVMNNDDIAYYKIPDNKYDVIDYFELISGEDDDSDGRIDDMEMFHDIYYQKLHLVSLMYAKHQDLISSEDIAQIISRIQKKLDIEFPDKKSRVTGEAPLFLRLLDYVIKGQLLTLFLCLVIVCLIIILLFKKVSIGLIALIPMSAAVIANFGIMGWSNINLDMATAIIASITIGIGVDDTIHFFNTFRHFMARGYSTDDAIKETLHISGKAIIYTSMALILGFSVFLLSNFKPNAYVGMLVAITMVATTLGALVVLPSTIKLTGFSFEESGSKSPIWKYLYIGKYFGLEDVEDEA